MILVVTGTNTDVGKTISTAALAFQLQDAGWEVIPVKPLQTGEPAGSGDAVTVEKLSGIKGTEFLRYPEPLAPNLAARRAGMEQARLDDIAKRVRELDGDGRMVLVEGAGGLLVRLADDWTIADLAVELNAPLVVVTSMGLGSLNSAELTVEAARRRGIEVLGLIGGSIAAEPDLATQLNVAEMEVVTSVPLWGCLPAGAGALDTELFAQAALNINLPETLASPTASEFS